MFCGYTHIVVNSGPVLSAFCPPVTASATDSPSRITSITSPSAISSQDCTEHGQIDHHSRPIAFSFPCNTATGHVPQPRARPPASRTCSTSACAERTPPPPQRQPPVSCPPPPPQQRPRCSRRRWQGVCRTEAQSWPRDQAPHWPNRSTLAEWCSGQVRGECAMYICVNLSYACDK